MKRVMVLLFGGAILSGLAAWAAMAQANAPKVQLWRLDCGTVRVNNLNAFSDTRSYTGQKRDLAASCYLVRNGDQYMLWDTGLPTAMKGAATNATDAMSPTLSITIVEQLEKIGVKPEQIGLIGISHLHFDHIGQAASFPKAKLLIGQGDLDLLRNPPKGVDPAPLAGWLGEGGNVEGVAGDKNVFGDGSVIMVNLPGHTPGHHGLLVTLKNKGAVLLSGDVAHFTENLDSAGVPPFNTDRADSLASMDRFRKLATGAKATAIIQHEQRDVGKLPAFPAAAD